MNKKVTMKEWEKSSTDKKIDKATGYKEGSAMDKKIDVAALKKVNAKKGK